MPDANVLFKRGQHSQLFNDNGTPKIAIQDGTFYLTEDTNRLYVGQRASTATDAEVNLIELNKSITTVNSIANLPSTGVQVGQFYYVTGTNQHSGATATNGNILAVVTGFDTEQNNKPIWVQVNPDTNTDHNDHITGFSIDKDSSSSSTTLVYKWQLDQADIDNVALASMSGTFAIASSDIANLAGVAVDLAAQKSGDNLVIKTSGDGATGSGVTLVPDGGITFEAVSGNTAQYKISSADTTYYHSVETANNAVKLMDSDDVSQGVMTFSASTAINISMIASNSNKDATITIQHANVPVTTANNGTDTADEPAFGGSFTVVSSVSRNDQGHVTGVKTKQVTLPVPDSYSITSVQATSAGQIEIALSDGTTAITASSGQDLYYVVNGTNVYNQGAIDFYTKAQIDAKINELDGMTYRGVVPANGLPSSNVKNGDTYKVNQEITIPGSATGEKAKVGDLFIATGTEGNDGYLTSITWDYIPAGDDYDTTYDFTAENNHIKLQDHDQNYDAQEVIIAGGNKLSVATTSATSTTPATITISHNSLTTTGNGVLSATAAAPSTTNELDYGGTFTVIHGVKADGYGHISEVQTETFKLPAAPTEIEYQLSGDTANNTVNLVEANAGNSGSIALATSGPLAVSSAISGTSPQAMTFTISHNTLSATHTNNATTAAASTISVENGFDAITALGLDDYGHVNAYTTSKYLLPDDVFVTLSGAVSGSNNVATVALDLKDSGDNSRVGTGEAIPAFTLSSSSLQISPTAASSTTPGNVAVDIVWGSFN